MNINKLELCILNKILIEQHIRDYAVSVLKPSIFSGTFGQFQNSFLFKKIAESPLSAISINIELGRELTQLITMTTPLFVSQTNACFWALLENKIKNTLHKILNTAPKDYIIDQCLLFAVHETDILIAIDTIESFLAYAQHPLLYAIQEIKENISEKTQSLNESRKAHNHLLAAYATIKAQKPNVEIDTLFTPILQLC